MFEVYDFGSRSTGEITSELKIHAESGNGHDKADKPVDQSETYRSCGVEDAASYTRVSMLFTSDKTGRWCIRVEKIPVPIIWLTFKKMIVNHPT